MKTKFLGIYDALIFEECIVLFNCMLRVYGIGNHDL